MTPRHAGTVAAALLAPGFYGLALLGAGLFLFAPRSNYYSAPVPTALAELQSPAEPGFPAGHWRALYFAAYGPAGAGAADGRTAGSAAWGVRLKSERVPVDRDDELWTSAGGRWSRRVSLEVGLIWPALWVAAFAVMYWRRAWRRGRFRGERPPPVSLGRRLARPWAATAALLAVVLLDPPPQTWGHWHLSAELERPSGGAEWDLFFTPRWRRLELRASYDEKVAPELDGFASHEDLWGGVSVESHVYHYDLSRILWLPWWCLAAPAGLWNGLTLARAARRRGGRRGGRPTP